MEYPALSRICSTLLPPPDAGAADRDAAAAGDAAVGLRYESSFSSLELFAFAWAEPAFADALLPYGGAADAASTNKSTSSLANSKDCR